VFALHRLGLSTAAIQPMDAQPSGAGSGEQMQPSAQFRACPEDQECGPLVSADDTLPLARPASDGSMEAAVTAAQAEAVPPELALVLLTGAVLLAPRHPDGSAAAPEVRGAPMLLRGGLGRRALAAGRRIGTALTVEQSRSDTATRPLPPVRTCLSAASVRAGRQKSALQLFSRHTQRLYLYGRASAGDNEEVHTHGPKSRVVGARQAATGEVGGCTVGFTNRQGTTR
jgi:hypothetical protein